MNFRHFKALLYKEYLQERAGKFILNSMLAFSVILIIIVVFPYSKSDLAVESKNIMLWVIIYFAAVTGMNHSFLKEVENETIIPLKYNFQGQSVFWAKVTFNLVALLVSVTIILILYSSFFNFEAILSLAMFGQVYLASLCIACGGTLLSALISQTAQTGFLYAIIGFPIFFPVFIIALNGSQDIIQTGNYNMENLFLLSAYTILTLAMSALVFDFIWETA